MYESVQAKIAECEQAALQKWQAMVSKSDDGQPPASNGAVQADIGQELIRVTGVDLFAVEGLGPGLVPKLLAETGLDMSAWPSDKHFASWAGLCPPNRITGGRRYCVGRPAKRSRIAQLFKMAAQGVANSKTALGAFYRRMRAKRGSGIANDATAHKLAKIFYRLLRYGHEYVARSVSYYDELYRERLTRSALKTLKRLGVSVQVTSMEEATVGS